MVADNSLIVNLYILALGDFRLQQRMTTGMYMPTYLCRRPVN